MRSVFVKAVVPMAAVLLFVAGCDKEESETAIAEPVVNCSFEANSTNLSVVWEPVENAESYFYELAVLDGETVSSGSQAAGEEKLYFENLSEDVDLLFSIRAQTSKAGFVDSNTATVEIHTPVIARVDAPEFKGSVATDVGACITWSKAADNFKYRLTSKSDPDSDLLSESITDTYVTFAGLNADTEYIVHVQSVSIDDPDLADSKEVSFEFRTEPTADATNPWVAVIFEYNTFAEKNTIFCHNVPNSTAVAYYTTTETVNVIGEGYASESTMAEYILVDYDDHVPGVYKDTPIHRFNNNGAGWKAGDKLFYAALAENANGKDVLNWFWVEMPSNPGDGIIILDSK